MAATITNLPDRFSVSEIESDATICAKLDLRMEIKNWLYVDTPIANSLMEAIDTLIDCKIADALRRLERP